MTRHLGAVAVAAVFTAVLMTFALVAAAQETSPLFRVERAELDLGTVIAGASATATFVFHNDGPEDVRIIRAKPS